jgi:hypothetical protein
MMARSVVNGTKGSINCAVEYDPAYSSFLAGALLFDDRAGRGQLQGEVMRTGRTLKPGAPTSRVVSTRRARGSRRRIPALDDQPMLDDCQRKPRDAACLQLCAARSRPPGRPR